VICDVRFLLLKNIALIDKETLQSLAIIKKSFGCAGGHAAILQ
jgi:hypothetical protein